MHFFLSIQNMVCVPFNWLTFTEYENEQNQGQFKLTSQLLFCYFQGSFEKCWWYKCRLIKECFRTTKLRSAPLAMANWANRQYLSDHELHYFV